MVKRITVNILKQYIIYDVCSLQMRPTEGGCSLPFEKWPKHLTVLMSESPNHLFNQFVQKVDLLNEYTPSITQRSFVLWSLFGTIFIGKIEQKQAILCLKCKSLIALLNMHTIIIKCVVMPISAEKKYSLSDIDQIYYITLY